MEIKLKPKQLAQITQIQQSKQSLNQMLQDLNNREMSLLELIFEGAGVEGEVKSLQLDGDKLKYEIVEKKEKVKSKLKKVPEPVS